MILLPPFLDLVNMSWIRFSDNIESSTGKGEKVEENLGKAGKICKNVTYFQILGVREETLW